MNAVSVMGGANIFLPDTVNVEVEGVSIMGGNSEPGTRTRPTAGRAAGPDPHLQPDGREHDLAAAAGGARPVAAGGPQARQGGQAALRAPGRAAVMRAGRLAQLRTEPATTGRPLLWKKMPG